MRAQLFLHLTIRIQIMALDSSMAMVYKLPDEVEDQLEEYVRQSAG